MKNYVCIYRVSSTSDFAGHVLLRGDNLVHVGSDGSLQRRTSCLTLLHYGLILGLGLTLNQTVHGIGDLITHTHTHKPLELDITTALQIHPF